MIGDGEQAVNRCNRARGYDIDRLMAYRFDLRLDDSHARAKTKGVDRALQKISAQPTWLDEEHGAAGKDRNHHPGETRPRSNIKPESFRRHKRKQLCRVGDVPLP